MTITALQKRCDQDELAVNTADDSNTFRGGAIPRQPVHPDRFVGAAPHQLRNRSLTSPMRPIEESRAATITRRCAAIRYARPSARRPGAADEFRACARRSAASAQVRAMKAQGLGRLGDREGAYTSMVSRKFTLSPAPRLTLPQPGNSRRSCDDTIVSQRVGRAFHHSRNRPSVSGDSITSRSFRPFEVVGVGHDTRAEAFLQSEHLPSQHEPAHVEIRQQW
jgi:hypothetical protein